MRRGKGNEEIEGKAVRRKLTFYLIRHRIQARVLQFCAGKSVEMKQFCTTGSEKVFEAAFLGDRKSVV